MVFNLYFANNDILSCFFFFLIIQLNCLIAAVITQIFNPTAELAIPKGMPTNEAKEEIETQAVIVQTKISKCSM